MRWHNLFNRRDNRPGRKARRHPSRHRLLVEELESRVAPAVLTVNTLLDSNFADDFLSLREAISLINHGGDAQLALGRDFEEGEAEQISGNFGDNDTIVFDSALAGETIELTAALPTIRRDLTIEGPGADLLTVDAMGLARVFTIDDGDNGTLIDVAIGGLTITGGQEFSGGGILNRENLTLIEVAVMGNEASDGGGIHHARGTLVVERSTMSGNWVEATKAVAGGGIFAQGDVILRSSTIDANTAESNEGDYDSRGGAIYIFGASLLVENSTISGNAAEDSGGGIFASQAAITIRNSTLTGNRADSDDGDAADGGTGGAIHLSNSTLILNNTIVAGNFRGSGTTPDDIAGSVDLANSFHNLIGDSGSAAGLTHNSGGNIVGVDVATVLDLDLADNGGPTRTHALVSGSPAIDAGNNAAAAGLPFDQRRFVRIVQGGIANTVDIGAFEFNAFAVPTTLVVDTLGDEHDGIFTPGNLTLREAIFLANLDPNPNTITFHPSLAGQTLLLSEIGDGTAGPSAFGITSDITITGLTGGAGITIARDSNADEMRHFFVAEEGKLTLEYLTLQDGVARGGDGASHQAGAGGGGAGLGGGIFNFGVLNILGLTFTNNQAFGGNGGQIGGAGDGGGGGGMGGPADGGTGGPPNGGAAGTSPTLAGGNGGFGGGGGGGAYGVAGIGGDGGFGGGGGGSSFDDFGNAGGNGGFGGGGGGAQSSNGSRQGGDGGFGGGDAGILNDPGVTTTGAGGGAGMGGAIFNHSGTVTIVNSTLAGNLAQGGAGGGGLAIGTVGQDGQGLGGALFNLNGNVIIISSTIAENIADMGGAIYNLAHAAANGIAAADATVTVANSILALSSDGESSDIVNQQLAQTATVHHAGPNLTSWTVVLGGTMSGIAATIATAEEINLGPLDFNGGPTKTMALLPGSIAIDAGDNNAAAGIDFDQRGLGFSRIRFGTVDIGAFEVQGVAFTGNRLSFIDTDGDRYTVRLRGPGLMTVYVAGLDKGPIEHIFVDNADPRRSRLSVGVKKAKIGDGLVTIGGISGDGLRRITAKRSPLVGNLELDGPLRRLTVHSVEGNISVSAIRRLTVRGDFAGDLTVSDGDLRVARIGGTISDAAWSIFGSLGRLAFSEAHGSLFDIGESLRRVTARRVVDSNFFIGFTPDSNDPLPAGDFTPGARIGSFTVSGKFGSALPAFVNSNIVATSIGRVWLLSVAANDDGDDFGVYATEIGGVTVRDKPVHHAFRTLTITP